MHNLEHEAFEHQTVGARLDLRPSDGIKELIEPFYRPSIAESKLARLALESEIEVPLEAYPAQRYIYRDPRFPDDNSIQTYNHFERHDLPAVAGHQLPLLSYVRFMRNKSGWLRVALRVGMNERDRERFANLHEFKPVAESGVLDVRFNIAPSHVVPNEDMLRYAAAGLKPVLGVNHPARARIPESRRYVDPASYYASTTGRLLIRPTRTPVV